MSLNKIQPSTPLLIIHGEDDEIIPLQHGQQLLQQYDSQFKQGFFPSDSSHNAYYVIDVCSKSYFAADVLAADVLAAAVHAADVHAAADDDGYAADAAAVHAAAVHAAAFLAAAVHDAAVHDAAVHADADDDAAVAAGCSC